jgi:hypothetical protein
MDWENAIKQCPSNKNGICNVLPGGKSCNDNVESGKCAISRLRGKMEDAMHLAKVPQKNGKR